MDNATVEAPLSAKENTMPNATLTLPSGTTVEIRGTAEEIHRILELHNSTERAKTPRTVQRARRGTPSTPNRDGRSVSIPEVINHVRSCEEAESVETHILDGTSQLTRVLLPLFVVHKYMEDAFALTAAEIAEVCRQLAVPIVPENVSKTLRGAAAKFVMLESGGSPRRFRINRRGLQHMTDILCGKKPESPK